MTLRTLVHEQEVEAAFTIARLIRDHPDATERREEAARQVRMTLYRTVIGELTRAERDRILPILLPCCPQIIPDFPRCATMDHDSDP